MRKQSKPIIMRKRSGVRPAAAALALAMAAMFVMQPAPAQSLDDSGSQDRERQRDRDSNNQRDRDRDREPDRDQARDQDQGGTLSRAELKKRFEERFEHINRLKNQGLIGETFNGYVEALDEGLLNGEQRDLIGVENADRKALYGLIADRVDEGEKRVPPRVVAERNARRNFDKAEPDHALQMEEGYWTLKRDLSRHERLARLKKDGVIGETWEGYVESIDRRPSEEVTSLVDEENRARRRLYGTIAERLERGSAEQVAHEIGQSTRESLPPGHSYKQRDGGWQKRQMRER